MPWLAHARICPHLPSAACCDEASRYLRSVMAVRRRARRPDN